jgi:hypothetical protein
MRDELLEELPVGVEEPPPDAERSLVNLVLDVCEELILPRVTPLRLLIGLLGEWTREVRIAALAARQPGRRWSMGT